MDYKAKYIKYKNKYNTLKSTQQINTKNNNISMHGGMYEWVMNKISSFFYTDTSTPITKIETRLIELDQLLEKLDDDIKKTQNDDTIMSIVLQKSIYETEYKTLLEELDKLESIKNLENTLGQINKISEKLNNPNLTQPQALAIQAELQQMGLVTPASAPVSTSVSASVSAPVSAPVSASIPISTNITIAELQAEDECIARNVQAKQDEAQLSFDFIKKLLLAEKNPQSHLQQELEVQVTNNNHASTASIRQKYNTIAFYNPGSLCYFNTALQLLYSITPIRESISRIDISRIHDDIRGLAIKGIYHIFLRMNRFNRLDPGKILDIECILYRGKQVMHDIWASWIQYTLHEDKAKFKYNTQEVFEFILHLINIFEETNIFTSINFNYMNKLICFTAQQKRIEYELSNDLSTILNVQITHNNRQPINLMDFLNDLFILQEPLTGDNLLRAAKYEECVEQRQSYKVNNMNQFIILHIVREQRTTNDKNMQQIIPDNIIQINSVRFKLVGCTIHTGTSQAGGHWKYYLFPNNNMSSVIIYNDSRITNNMMTSELNAEIMTNMIDIVYERIY